MATVHRISEEFFDDSFDLIALHCNMQPFALAYYINRETEIVFQRAKKDLEIAGVLYPLYEYKDYLKGEEWYLLSNSAQEEVTHGDGGLFGDSAMFRTSYLLSDRKEVNFLLKIYLEHSIEIEKTIKAIRTIPKVSMAYQLNTNDLKSKRNLIF